MTVRKNILVGWLSHLVTVLIGFFLMPFILGTVGEAQYGSWVLINAVAGYSTMVYSGFGATICRFVADLSARKEWTRLNSVASTIQLVYVGTASIVLVLTAICAWAAPSLANWEGVAIEEVRLAMLIVGGTIGFGMIASVYGGVLIGLQRLDITRSIEITVGVIRLLLTLFCLHQKFGLVTLGLIFLTVTVIEHAVSAWFAYRYLPSLSIAPWNFRRDVLRECFAFSSFNAIALTAEYLIYFTDTIVIGVVLGPLAVVPYQIGLRIAQMIQVPIGQIGDAVMPRASQLHVQGKRRELSQLVCRACGLALLLAGSFIIGASYFGDSLIQTWIGKSYPQSTSVLLVLLGAQVIALPMVVVRRALVGIGDVRVQALIDLAEALCNVTLSLLLIHWWGILGVAWGTLIPLVVIETTLLMPYAMKKLEIGTRRGWQDVLAPQIPALAALLVYCETMANLIVIDGWLSLIGVTLGGGVVALGIRAFIHLLETKVTSRPLGSPVPGIATTSFCPSLAEPVSSSQCEVPS